MRNFFDLTMDDLRDFLRERSLPLVHAKGIFNVEYRTLLNPLNPLNPLSLNLGRKHTVSKKLETLIASSFSKATLTTTVVSKSAYDYSVKFVFKTTDDYEIETVLMPEKNRLTVCLSSQVGCAQGCVFCHTGRMGLARNLTAGEIVSQVIEVNRWVSKNPEWAQECGMTNTDSVSNVVFMGMGEPLDNVPSLVSAIKILCEPHGLALAPRKITVSTAGHIDGLNQFVRHGLKTGLAFSLHALTDRSRSKIMPINRKWGLETVVGWLENYTADHKTHVFIQYTLIKGVNDRESDVDKLANLLKNVRFKLNLIPLNPVGGSRLQAPSPEDVESFRDLLYQCGIRVMVRYSKGQDISAGCGQLVRTAELKADKAQRARE